MSFDFAPFDRALKLALDIYYRVIARDGLIERPKAVRNAVAARLKVGIRAMEAFLRRILILLALTIEHELVVEWKPENMARTKAKKPRLKKPSLLIFPPVGPMPDHILARRYQRVLPAKCVARDVSDVYDNVPVLVPISHLLAKLDHLHAIATNPMAKARRLAYSLARSRHGILMPPSEHPRLVWRWGTEVSAIHDAIGFQIIQKSRERPPPAPPPRRGPKPSITRL